MAQLFTLVTTQGSVVASDCRRANGALWRIRARTRIEGNIAACKKTTLLEAAIGVGIVARPRGMRPFTVWSRNKMADLF